MVAPSQDSRELRLAHYVSLSGFGGVEQQFATFLQRAARYTAIHQAVVVGSSKIHAHHRPALRDADLGVFDEKKIAGITLGHHPAGLRRARYRWIARRTAPDVALLWNRLGFQHRVLDALGPRRCLYWEHGSAWLAGEEDSKTATLARLPAVICNSYASKRMLEAHWGYQGVARVCLNGMRASVPAGTPRTLESNRSLRLGAACRLVPIKATVLALHALAELVRRGVDATLDVAGDGPLRESLEQWARDLGVAERVNFRGVVRDMPAFFQQIDVLLHPALREPFGVVAAEAMWAGCPVVCTAVDGLPEVVEHGVTGVCVPATGDLTRYRELGGATDGLPPVVYDPLEDRIRAPQICEPSALAEAIETMVGSCSDYSQMSRAAIQRVTSCFDFECHVDDVLAASREYADTGTLALD